MLNILEVFTIIISFTIPFSIATLYLDSFKLSNSPIIKTIQILSLFSFLLLLVLQIWQFNNLSGLSYSCISDGSSSTPENNQSVSDSLKSSDRTSVSLNTNVDIGREAAREISLGLSSLGTQIGIGATVAGVATAVGKSITSSSLPPAQKAAIIVGGALAGGAIHVGTSAINRKNAVTASKSINDSMSASATDNIKKYLDPTNSPIQDLLYSIDILNTVCLALVFILTIQIIFKFFLHANGASATRFDISSFVGINLNNRLNEYFKKLISINKKVSNIYIILILIILLISLYYSSYFSHELYTNINEYVNIYKSN